MKADFTPKEMIYNFIYKDKSVWIHNEDGSEELKIINYVKLVPNSPIMMTHFYEVTIMIIELPKLDLKLRLRATS